jgi:hypothetical protein
MLRRVVEAPWLISETYRVVDGMNRELMSLRSEMQVASQVQFEALTLLTRAVNELNSRVEQLDKVGESSAP